MTIHRAEMIRDGTIHSVVLGTVSASLTSGSVDIGVHWDDAQIKDVPTLIDHVTKLKRYIEENRASRGTDLEWRVGMDNGEESFNVDETDSLASPATYTTLADDVAIEFVTASFDDDIDVIFAHVAFLLQFLVQEDFQPE